ncbi:hypothetical protein NDU88_000041 [Pleurodeles waltl]|uniref:Uncharacterized protein n=1 Tax=Pleurodeles waltl TaxID=8319 RepID=A0AAV7VW92_PLEWA|nr:hypothetical protein NDU88_000041 [Pleurodeles waltl]
MLNSAASDPVRKSTRASGPEVSWCHTTHQGKTVKSWAWSGARIVAEGRWQGVAVAFCWASRLIPPTARQGWPVQSGIGSEWLDHRRPGVVLRCLEAPVNRGSRAPWRHSAAGLACGGPTEGHGSSHAQDCGLFALPGGTAAACPIKKAWRRAYTRSDCGRVVSAVA